MLGWRLIAALGLLLAGSIGGNLFQWRHAAVQKAEAREAALKETLAATAGIARQAQQDYQSLYADLVIAVARSQNTRVVYERVAAKAPLASNCAPGKARVDAVNAGADP